MTHPLTGPVKASGCERVGDGEIERDREREKMKEGAEMRDREQELLGGQMWWKDCVR